jgi:hypothetical protein
MPAMTANVCPACGKTIAIDDINVREGVGLCRACGKLSRLADIADQPVIDPKALAAPPPPGCSIEETFGGGSGGGGKIIRASLRSPGSAIGAGAICLFWNGIVSIFLLFAIGGLYTNLVGPLPKWFPIPSGGSKGNLSGHMGMGETIFLCIFLTPFVLIGLMFLCAFLACLVGRIEVTLDAAQGRVRTGFGPFNWTRRFDPAQVKRVAGGRTAYQVNDQTKPTIVIEADRTIKFGSTLPDHRREWLLAALHQLLIAKAKLGKLTSDRPAYVGR